MGARGLRAGRGEGEVPTKPWIHADIPTQDKSLKVWKKKKKTLQTMKDASFTRGKWFAAEPESKDTKLVVWWWCVLQIPDPPRGSYSSTFIPVRFRDNL